MISKCLANVVILSTLLVIASCGKSPFEKQNESTGSLTAGHNLGSGTIPEKFSGIKLTIPEDIPERINDLAAERAISLGCDGLRILQAEKDGKIKYHILYFAEATDNPVNECFLTPEGDFEAISEDEMGFVDLIWEKHQPKLGKATHGIHYCLRLAEFYKGTSMTGDMFRVTQAAHATTGYFHKLISCLDVSGCLAQCESPTFPGNFHDCISSHNWDSFAFASGLYTWPDIIRVYKSSGFVDPAWSFTGYPGAAGGDGDWGDNGDADDNARSLRLQYYIRSF